jgi:hypothetical protein
MASLIENEELVVDRERLRLAEAQARERAGIPDLTFAGTQPPADSHDTVGAVALDAAGNLAAATSTGGTLNKAPGRVGDSSLIGCGGYADNRSAAASLTGWGEPIMKLVLGKWAVDRVPQLGPEQAAQDAIAYLYARLQGHGGMILLGPGWPLRNRPQYTAHGLGCLRPEGCPRGHQPERTLAERMDHVSMTPKLILASASPRRRELLAQAGYRFEVQAILRARVAPAGRGRHPLRHQARPAEGRGSLCPAPSRRRHGKTAMVLGADTVVVCDGEVLGKPV